MKTIFYLTRSYAALRAADLDWIVGPGYSLGWGRNKQKRDRGRVTTDLGGGQGRNKQKRDRGGVTTDLGGGQGRNKQKRDRGGGTTDLLDV